MNGGSSICVLPIRKQSRFHFKHYRRRVRSDVTPFWLETLGVSRHRIYQVENVLPRFENAQHERDGFLVFESSTSIGVRDCLLFQGDDS